jgi:hypothetical protein
MGLSREQHLSMMHPIQKPYPQTEPARLRAPHIVNRISNHKRL